MILNLEFFPLIFSLHRFSISIMSFITILLQPNFLNILLSCPEHTSSCLSCLALVLLEIMYDNVIENFLPSHSFHTNRSFHSSYRLTAQPLFAFLSVCKIQTLIKN